MLSISQDNFRFENSDCEVLKSSNENLVLQLADKFFVQDGANKSVKINVKIINEVQVSLQENNT